MNPSSPKLEIDDDLFKSLRVISLFVHSSKEAHPRQLKWAQALFDHYRLSEQQKQTLEIENSGDIDAIFSAIESREDRRHVLDLLSNAIAMENRTDRTETSVFQRLTELNRTLERNFGGAPEPDYSILSGEIAQHVDRVEMWKELAAEARKLSEPLSARGTLLSSSLSGSTALNRISAKLLMILVIVFFILLDAMLLFSKACGHTGLAQ